MIIPHVRGLLINLCGEHSKQISKDYTLMAIYDLLKCEDCQIEFKSEPPIVYIPKDNKKVEK